MSRTRDLVSKLILDSAQFDTGINRARRSANQFGARMGAGKTAVTDFGQALDGIGVRTPRFVRNLGIMKAGVAGFAAALGAAALVIRQTGKQMDDIDRVGKADRRLGMEGNLQGLLVKGGMGGVDESKMIRGLQRFHMNFGNMLADSVGSVPVKSAFSESLSRLVGDVGAFKDMSSTEKLKKVADGIRGISDTSEKMALATTMFGRAGADMLTFLDEGGFKIQQMLQLAERQGLKLTGAQVRAVEDANDAWGRFQNSVKGFWWQLAAALAPTREGIFTRLSMAVEELTQFLMSRDNVMSDIKAMMSGAFASASVVGGMGLVGRAAMGRYTDKLVGGKPGADVLGMLAKPGVPVELDRGAMAELMKNSRKAVAVPDQLVKFNKFLTRLGKFFTGLAVGTTAIELTFVAFSDKTIADKIGISIRTIGNLIVDFPLRIGEWLAGMIATTHSAINQALSGNIAGLSEIYGALKGLVVDFLRGLQPREGDMLYKFGDQISELLFSKNLKEYWGVRDIRISESVDRKAEEEKLRKKVSDDIDRFRKRYMELLTPAELLRLEQDPEITKFQDLIKAKEDEQSWFDQIHKDELRKWLTAEDAARLDVDPELLKSQDEIKEAKRQYALRQFDSVTDAFRTAQERAEKAMDQDLLAQMKVREGLMFRNLGERIKAGFPGLFPETTTADRLRRLMPAQEANIPSAQSIMQSILMGRGGGGMQEVIQLAMNAMQSAEDGELSEEAKLLQLQLDFWERTLGKDKVQLLFAELGI